MEQFLKEVAVVLFSIVLSGAIYGLCTNPLKKPGVERSRE